MPTRKQRVSLSFHIISPDTFDTFAVGIRDGIFGNPTEFATPPVTQTALQTLIDNYINTRAAYKQGGKAQKGFYLAARTALMGALDTLAGYVNTLADGDADIITTAGFVPTKPSTSTAPVPAAPLLRTLSRGSTRQLIAECKPVSSAEYYGCILIQGTPMPPVLTFNGNGQLVAVAESNTPPNPNEYKPEPGSIIIAIDFNKSRRKQFAGLIKGVEYFFYFYAVNASGVSPLSEPFSIVCG